MNTLVKNAAITFIVVSLHAGLIFWIGQSSSAFQPPEVITPVEVHAEFITPPAPPAAPPTPTIQPSTPSPSPQSVKPAMPAMPKAVQKVVQKVASEALVQPSTQAQPLAISDPTPAPNAPVGSAAPVAAVAATAAPTPTPASATVQLPSSDADYLQNPKPTYPPLSRRLGEQGKVLVRVLIGADGQPQKAELKQSSGFERLDQAALATVLKWRYVPGKRGGIAQEMWFNVPINFVLE